MARLEGEEAAALDRYAGQVDGVAEDAAGKILLAWCQQPGAAGRAGAGIDRPRSLSAQCMPFPAPATADPAAITGAVIVALSPLSSLRVSCVVVPAVSFASRSNSMM